MRAGFGCVASFSGNSSATSVLSTSPFLRPFATTTLIDFIFTLI
jgi:hypothetical protein